MVFFIAYEPYINAVFGRDYMMPFCRDEISTYQAEADFTLRLDREINFFDRFLSGVCLQKPIDFY